MSMTSFFEKLIGTRQKQAATTISNYRELVARIVNGKEPQADEVERLLNTAGKSVDDLRRDAEHFGRRLLMKEKLAVLPKIEAERRMVERKLNDAEKAFEEYEKRHDEETAPLRFRLDELKQGISEASDASTKLIHTCNDPALLQEMENLNAEYKKLQDQLRQAQERANFMRNKAETEDERASRETSHADIEGRKSVAERYRNDAELANREAQRLRRTQEALLKSRDEIQARMRLA